MIRCGPPICVPCAVTMRCAKNSYVVADPEPSTFYYADMYECPNCGAQVVTGFGQGFEDQTLLPPDGVSLHFRYGSG